jgi:hypothetical protein
MLPSNGEIGMARGVIKSLSALSVALLATACASPGKYPSLATRDAERATGTLQPAEAEPYVPPATPTETLDRLGRLTAEAQAAHQTFLAAAERARGPAAAGRGASEGSNAWSVAQIALADVESARSATMIALAELDRLYTDTELAGGDLSQIGPARDEAAGLVAAEDAALDALRGGA